MELKNYFAQDQLGNMLPAALCYLYLANTETLATGLVNVNDMALPNPFYSDSYGAIQVKAPDGLYDLRVVSGSRDYTIRVQFMDVTESLAVVNAAKATAVAAATTATEQADIAEAAAIEAVNAQNQLRTDLGTPSGTNLIGFDQSSSADTVTRVLTDKVRDVVSVKDFGAVGNGITDDTVAFIKAGKGAYVPRGNYLVDTSQIIISNYFGHGQILSKTGAVIALQTDVQGSHYAMRKIMEPFYGFNNGTTNTEIYTGAQYAPQGLAYHRDPVTGAQRMFISQSVGSGADWGPDEYVRITEFNLREDGAVQTHVQFTPELRASHAHLSAITDSDGKLYMYSSGVAPIGTTDLNAGVGKGWSKMEWKGTGNTSADIQNFYVWGMPGSGHRYQQYGKGCAQVSQDGKYVIIIGINYVGSAGGRTLFVYDRKQVESMADPLKAEPVYVSTPLANFPADGETAYQGETCDGRYIYVCWGSGSVFGRRGISIYTLTGEKVRDIHFDGPSSKYTNDELFSHPTLGAATAFEPEGISLRGDEIFVTFTDFFREDPDVVEWEGKNYSNLMINNVGRQPDTDMLHWKITSKAATRGTWDSATTYVVGNSTRRGKIIYSIRPAQGTSDELPCTSTYTYPYSVAQYPGNASIVVNASHDLGSTYRVSAHIVPTDTYRTSFDYRYGYTLAVFDQRAGSDNTVRASLRMSTTGGSQVASVIAGDGTSTGGSYLSLFTTASGASPGEARLSSSGATALVRLQVNGATALAASDLYVTSYNHFRGITTNTYNLGSAAYLWKQLYAGTTTISTSDERAKTHIDDISDDILDAWATVEYQIFKLKDAIVEKGEDAARWHFGVIAQRVQSAFELVGIDPFKLGILCYDEWDDIYETDEDGNLFLARAAGNAYGVRYEEALCLEAALLRREKTKVTTKLLELEARLEALEAK